MRYSVESYSCNQLWYLQMNFKKWKLRKKYSRCWDMTYVRPLFWMLSSVQLRFSWGKLWCGSEVLCIYMRSLNFVFSREESPTYRFDGYRQGAPVIPMWVYRVRPLRDKLLHGCNRGTISEYSASFLYSFPLSTDCTSVDPYICHIRTDYPRRDLWNRKVDRSLRCTLCCFDIVLFIMCQNPYAVLMLALFGSLSGCFSVVMKPLDKFLKYWHFSIAKFTQVTVCLVQRILSLVVWLKKVGFLYYSTNSLSVSCVFLE